MTPALLLLEFVGAARSPATSGLNYLLSPSQLLDQWKNISGSTETEFKLNTDSMNMALDNATRKLSTLEEKMQMKPTHRTANGVDPHESLLERSQDTSEDGRSLRSTGEATTVAGAAAPVYSLTPPSLIMMVPPFHFPKSPILYHDDRMDEPSPPPMSLVELAADVSVEGAGRAPVPPQPAQPAAAQSPVEHTDAKPSAERVAAEATGQGASPLADPASPERQLRNASLAAAPATSFLSEAVRVKAAAAPAATQTTPSRVVAVDPAAMEGAVPQGATLIGEGDSTEPSGSGSGVVALLSTAALLLYFN